MDTNRTTTYTYNADGKVVTLTVRNSETGDQVTRFVYGTTLEDSDIASNELLRAKIYPDSDDTSDPLGNGVDWAYDRVEYCYNGLGQMKEAKDQAGTIHAYDYDKLGRLIHDRVTALGSGVDDSVRRISREYEVRGMLAKVTSYDNAAVNSGSVVNEVALNYDEFGQLAADQQAHSGSVNSGTPAVSYAYEDGSANTVRPTGITYPDGREQNFDYGVSDGMDDALSRISGIKDDDDSVLASYTRLGMNQVVKVGYPQPGAGMTYIKRGGEEVGDGGDPYTGLDRFGRVEDVRWIKGGDNDPLQIGGYEYTGAAEYLHGRISELIVYNTALSDGQVAGVEEYLREKYGIIGSGGSQSVEPLSLDGCVLWLKADGIEGVEDGDPVEMWPDASGLGNDASQATSSKQFIYRASGGPNGLPACEADGDNDLMEILGSDSLEAKRLTVFAVAESLGSGVGNGWVAMRLVRSNPAWGLAAKMVGPGSPCVSLKLDGGWSDYNYNTSTPDGFNILASRYDGSAVKHWLNGSAAGTISASGDIATGGVEIERVQHGYDRASNRLWRQNRVAGTGEDELYSYDGLNQLTMLQRGTMNINGTAISGTPAKEEDFTYDPAGNWMNYLAKVSGTVEVDQDRGHNKANETVQLDGSSATVACDAVGNMVRMPKVGNWGTAQELTWDAWNRLVKVSEGETLAEYAYDGLFRRTVKAVTASGQGDVKHYYYSSQWQVLEERGTETGSAQRQFVWGLLGVDDLVLRDEAGAETARLYALHDAMHVTAIVDASGTVLERYGYDAFGNSRVMDGSFNDISASLYDWETRFCGYRWDSETGLYQVRYRYLHGGLGRWLSRDPIGDERPGFQGSGMVGFGLYFYVRNGPVNGMDSSGLLEATDCPIPGEREPVDVPVPDETPAENVLLGIAAIAGLTLTAYGIGLAGAALLEAAAGTGVGIEAGGLTMEGISAIAAALGTSTENVLGFITAAVAAAVGGQPPSAIRDGGQLAFKEVQLSYKAADAFLNMPLPSSEPEPNVQYPNQPYGAFPTAPFVPLDAVQLNSR